jgi:hypothetical protein
MTGVADASGPALGNAVGTSVSSVTANEGDFGTIGTFSGTVANAIDDAFGFGAAQSALGSLGSIAGGLIGTALGGPLGGVAGSAIGGMVGGRDAGSSIGGALGSAAGGALGGFGGGFGSAIGSTIGGHIGSNLGQSAQFGVAPSVEGITGINAFNDAVDTGKSAAAALGLYAEGGRVDIRRPAHPLLLLRYAA